MDIYINDVLDLTVEINNQSYNFNLNGNTAIGRVMSNENEYFKENNYFDEIDFKKNVIGNPEIIESFDSFKQNFEENYEIQPKSEFEISFFPENDK